MSGWRRRRAEKRERAAADYERAVARMASRTREIIEGIAESMGCSAAVRIDVKEAPGMPGGTEVSLSPSRPKAASVWAYPEDDGLVLLVSYGELWIPVEDGWEAYFATFIRAVLDGRYREEYLVRYDDDSRAWEHVTMIFETPGESIKIDAGEFPTTSVAEGPGERRYVAYR